MIIKSWSNWTICWTCKKKNGIHPQLNFNHIFNKSFNHVRANDCNMLTYQKYITIYQDYNINTNKLYILITYILKKAKISSFLIIRVISSRWIFSSSFRAISSSFTIFEPSIFEPENPWKLLEIARKCSDCRFRALLEEP